MVGVYRAAGTAKKHGKWWTRDHPKGIWLLNTTFSNKNFFMALTKNELNEN
jgi:hypothetical protein